jgi:hypothetical protein
MANEVVQYPSYSQKAAYPVSHKPVDAVIQSETIEPSETVAAPEAASAPVELAPKFFPLVPVASQQFSDTDASVEPTPANEVAAAEVELIAEITKTTDEPDDELTDEPVDELTDEPIEKLVEEPDAELYPFQISGSLVLEPQTNSIVITEVPDALLTGSIVTETGEILTTGAIEIIAPPATGEIEIIPDSPDADSADAIDSATEFVSSVAPIRSSGVMNSKAKIGVLPGKLRKSMEHVVLATTLAVSIITVSSLLALAYMFGILR